MPKRCAWATTPLSIAYHDEEWGVPVHDDTRLFEFLILEGAQAGLVGKLFSENVRTIAPLSTASIQQKSPNTISERLPR